MTEKKSYSVPQLFRVALDPDQAILTACSLMTSAAFNNGTARCNTTFVPCKRISVNLGDNGPRLS